METQRNLRRYGGGGGLLLSGTAVVVVALLQAPSTVHATQLSPGTHVSLADLPFGDVITNLIGGNIEYDVIIPEPPFHHSFVRDSGGLMLRDFEYSADVAATMKEGENGTNATIVDIGMVQCFSGGFLDDIQRDVTASHTFASASLWSEVALDDPNGIFTVVGLKRLFPPPPVIVPHVPFLTELDYLDNFTRPWRQDFWDSRYYPAATPAQAAILPQDTGFLHHFITAARGNNVLPPTPPSLITPAILKDPYARQSLFPILQPDTESPQYESPDATPGGVNDMRDLVLANGASHRYAILVIWGEGDFRSHAEIRRVYSTLRALGVPASNIAVLTDTGDNTPPAKNLPNPGLLKQWVLGTNVVTELPTDVGTAVGPTDLGGLPPVSFVDATTHLWTWLDALAGKFFTIQPEPGDALFIYNTGHGAHLVRAPFVGEFEWDWHSNESTNSLRWTNIWQFSRIRNSALSASVTYPISYFDDTIVPGQTTGEDTNDIVRIYLDPTLLPLSQLSPTGSVTINGVYFPPPLIPDAVTNVLPLDPEVQTSKTVAYSFIVSHSIWAGITNITVQIDDDPAYVPANSNLVAAVDLMGGRQEFLVVNTNSSSWFNGNTNVAPHVALTIGPGSIPESFNIFWPTVPNGSGEFLQFTHGLSPPVNWFSLTNPIVDFGTGLSGLTIYATNSPPTNTFYRLIGP